MITEESIKETKFYRGIDEKVYLVSNIESVKLVTLIDTIEGVQSQLLLGDDVCGEFAPVLPEFKAFIENQIAPARPVPKNRSIRKKPARTLQDNAQSPGESNSRGRGSNTYKGVKSEKPYKDGRPRFSANYFDKQLNKVKYIGTFDNEFLAAAAVEEKLGNHQEAARLRALVAEHKDLNPDKPRQKRSYNRGKSKKTVWVCKRCALEYQSSGTCANCGCDDMRKVPME